MFVILIFITPFLVFTSSGMELPDIPAPDTKPDSLFYSAEIDNAKTNASLADTCFEKKLIQALSNQLNKKQSFMAWLNNPLYDKEYLPFPEDERFELYDGEFRNHEYIKADMATQIFAGSMAEIFLQTRPGRELRRIEKHVVRFLNFSYTKNLMDGQATWLLPGQAIVTRAGKKNEKEFGIAFTGKLSGSRDSLGSPIMEINTWYKELALRTKYDQADREFGCELSSRLLDRYTGWHLGLGFVTDPDESAAVMEIFFEF